jgi:hypothetical protein
MLPEAKFEETDDEAKADTEPIGKVAGANIEWHDKGAAK